MNVEAGAHFRPYVTLDAETGLCEISGESYLEEATQFYKPIYDWLNNYILTKRPLTFNFKLSYVNTSSSKHLIYILRLLKDYQASGNKVDANWYIEPGDSDTEEDVEDYMIISGLNINVIKMD